MSTTYQSTLAKTAIEQYYKYNSYHETDTPLRSQINKYWDDIGLPFPGVGTPWSAVFISWCVKKAGATDQEFKFSSQHSVFVKWAIANAGVANALFVGRDMDYTPKIGDIIQNNRNGHAYDFKYAKSNANYESHSAIVVELGDDSNGKYLRTIGGNEGDTVGRRKIRLYKDGRIKQPIENHFISIIEVLK